MTLKCFIFHIEIYNDYFIYLKRLSFLYTFFEKKPDNHSITYSFTVLVIFM